MFGRFRSAIYSAMGTADGEPAPNVTDLRSRVDSVNGTVKAKVKYGYQRPIFLQLFSDDEIQVTADHMVRPIMVPRDIQILPWYAGYAEAINAGKSVRNEDQAAYHRGVLRTQDADSRLQFTGDWEIPYVYFGIFDGHAGSGCAVTAANELHQVVHKKLMACLNHLVPKSAEATEINGSSSNGSASLWYSTKEISVESLIIGALESAFWEMDQSIGEDKKRYKMLGGCTVIISLFILGKLYVANAGDSRACLCRSGGAAYPMSYDFTPVTERARLQQLGYQKPHLMGAEYTHLDFHGRKPSRDDVGKRALYRDAHMTGWAYKDITVDDLRFPLVYGEGKRSRLLATIGVTRGFGDHDLKAQSNSANPIYIKPFLTPQPEVRVLDIENEEVTEADVLVIATDGLWDVVSNDRVAQIVDHGLRLTQKTEEVRQKYKFISIAQELVMAARGKLVERNWKHSDESPATIDDISVFAIPILPYKTEYAEWKVSKKSSHSSNNGLEETGNVNLTNFATEEMDIDPAEEVTVSDVSLTIKDEIDEAEDDESRVNDDDNEEEDEEAQK